MEPSAIAASAQKLRVEGRTWSEIADTLREKGAVNRNGNPFTANTIVELVKRQAKKKTPAHPAVIVRPKASYERIDNLPQPPKGFVMLVIARPDQVAAVAQQVMT